MTIKTTTEILEQSILSALTAFTGTQINIDSMTAREILAEAATKQIVQDTNEPDEPVMSPS